MTGGYDGGDAPPMPPRTLRISTRNSTFQVLESLRTNRQKRRSTGTFLVEGVQPVSLALANGWTFDAVLHEDGRALSRWAVDVLERTPSATRYALTRDLLDALSGRDEGSELIAVVHVPDESIEDLELRADLLVVVVDRPSSPGNLGTLIRSCDALGAHALVVTGHAVDLYDPAVIAASRGSLFALPVVRLDSHAEVAALVDRARAHLGHCRLVGADERGTVDADACDFRPATVLVFGNEAHGLSHAYQQMCDTLVRIPMTGAASSLNVSVAASIVLYEASRQRRLG